MIFGFDVGGGGFKGMMELPGWLGPATVYLAVSLN